MKAATRAEKMLARKQGRKDKRTAGGLSAKQVRQVRGDEIAVVVDGYFTADGEPVPVQQMGLTVPAGEVYTPAPVAADGFPVTPGESYAAAADVDDPAGWVGLQWLTTDGEPGPIVWDGGRIGRVVVQGIAPVAAAGCRQLLVAYDPGDPPVDPAALAVWESLAEHIAEVTAL